MFSSYKSEIKLCLLSGDQCFTGKASSQHKGCMLMEEGSIFTSFDLLSYNIWVSDYNSQARLRFNIAYVHINSLKLAYSGKIWYKFKLWKAACISQQLYQLMFIYLLQSIDRCECNTYCVFKIILNGCQSSFVLVKSCEIVFYP